MSIMDAIKMSERRKDLGCPPSTANEDTRFAKVRQANFPSFRPLNAETRCENAGSGYQNSARETFGLSNQRDLKLFEGALPKTLSMALSEAG